MAAFDLARSMVKDVTFRSQVTPDYTWDPFAPAPPREQGGFFSWLTAEVIKPAVYVRTPGGIVPAELYGPPRENYLPVVAAGTTLVALAGVATVFGLGMWWGRKTATRRK